MQNQDDNLLGGFEILALNNKSEEEKGELLDTIEKLLNFEKTT